MCPKSQEIISKSRDRPPRAGNSQERSPSCQGTSQPGFPLLPPPGEAALWALTSCRSPTTSSGPLANWATLVLSTDALERPYHRQRECKGYVLKIISEQILGIWIHRLAHGSQQSSTLFSHQPFCAEYVGMAFLRPCRTLLIWWWI